MIASTQSNHPLAGVASQLDSQRLLDTACDRLRHASLRITKPRVAILSALIKRDIPVTIEQLHQDLQGQSCDLVTVYRCLGAFEEIGLVRRSFQHSGTALYEIADASRPRHYHIECRVCHRSEPVEYFPLGEFERVLAERGYRELSHIVEFFGVCPACAQTHQRDALLAQPKRGG